MYEEITSLSMFNKVFVQNRNFLTLLTLLCDVPALVFHGNPVETYLRLFQVLRRKK
ncbi:hypothetical protein HanRHA438_Chr10g0460161 [Helianthus annuus]|nr:hypothetical protein HanRHA438_Chr10g0460161 [Helianthus annuus]